MTISESTGTSLIRDAELYYRCVGEGPDVVVLHGGPGAHHDYLLPAFDSLARGRKLRYYDQRGGGRSAVGREVPVGWEEQVADLEALRSHWGIERLTLVGYSWGGLLALLYLTRHPEKLQQLALVSPAPAWHGARLEFERVFGERNLDPDLQRRRRELRESGLREVDEEAYRQRLFELSVAAYFYDQDRVTDLTPFRITGRTQQEVWSSLGEYDLRQAISDQAVPSLVIHGADDPIPSYSAEDTAKRLGAEFHLLPQCGHVPYVEAYQDFHQLLHDFLPAAD